MNKKKNIVKQLKQAGVSHILNVIKDIKTSAKDSARDNYEIDLNILEPNVKTVFKDLNEWNDTRKEESRLNREEMKQLGNDIMKETKRVLLHEESEHHDDDAEMQAFFDEFDFDDLGLESGTPGGISDIVANFFATESEEVDIEKVASDIYTKATVRPVELELRRPEDHDIGLMVLGLLQSFDNKQFANTLIRHMDSVHNLLGINPDVHKERMDVITDSMHDYHAEITSRGDEEVVEREVPEFEYEETVHNPLLNGEIGTESVSHVYDDIDNISNAIREVLRQYQADEVFSSTVDRVMTLYSRILVEHQVENDINGDLMSSNGELLATNNLTYMIMNVFNLNSLDTISLYTLFSLFLNTEAELDIVVGLREITDILRSKLDGSFGNEDAELELHEIL